MTQQTRITTEDELLDHCEATPEMEGFAWFEVDASQMKHVDGPQKGELIFPELEGVYTPLWDITSNAPYAKERYKTDKQDAKDAHAARIEEYRARVADNMRIFEEGPQGPLEDELEGVDDCPMPESQNLDDDDWQDFWMGASPVVTMIAERD